MEQSHILQVEHDTDGDDRISFETDDGEVIGFYPDGKITLRGAVIAQDVEAVSLIAEFIQTAVASAGNTTPSEETSLSDQ